MYFIQKLILSTLAGKRFSPIHQPQPQEPKRIHGHVQHPVELSGQILTDVMKHQGGFANPSTPSNPNKPGIPIYFSHQTPFNASR